LCRSWPREEKLNNHGCFVSTHTFLTMIIEGSVCCMSCEPILFAIILMWCTRNIFFFINWTVRMSDNIPEINRIICCQIFCALLWKSVFELIFNVMQLILVKIKWHIKWKYIIKKFHDIGLSYYFNMLYDGTKMSDGMAMRQSVIV
jgi:hypothetical protein